MQSTQGCSTRSPCLLPFSPHVQLPTDALGALAHSKHTVVAGASFCYDSRIDALSVISDAQPKQTSVTGLDPFGGDLSGASSVQRPNLVSGAQLWIANPNVAGEKEINPAAIAIPAGAVQGDLGRNALRGFGTANVD